MSEDLKEFLENQELKVGSLIELEDIQTLLDYINELYEENQLLKQSIDEMDVLVDKYNLGKYDYSIPVYEMKLILDKVNSEHNSENV